MTTLNKHLLDFFGETNALVFASRDQVSDEKSNKKTFAAAL